jgi:erythromycin esterase-like protein
MGMSIQDAGWVFVDDGRAALTALLNSLPAKPRLIALGDAVHGEEALPRQRNQLFQYPVEDVAGAA